MRDDLGLKVAEAFVLRQEFHAGLGELLVDVVDGADVRGDAIELGVHFLHVQLHGPGEHRGGSGRGDERAVELADELAHLGDLLVHMPEGARDNLLLLRLAVVLGLDDLLNSVLACAQRREACLELDEEAVQLSKFGLDDRGHVRDGALLGGLGRCAYAARELVADDVQLLAELHADLDLLLALRLVGRRLGLEVAHDVLEAAHRGRHLLEDGVVIIALLFQSGESGLGRGVLRDHCAGPLHQLSDESRRRRSRQATLRTAGDAAPRQRHRPRRAGLARSGA